jgi:hypothetical protein
MFLFLDTCLLLYWVIDTLLAYLYDIKQTKFFSLMHISAFSCYFSYMINRLCAALCSWLITCFTFIRFINLFRQFDTIKSNLILLTSLIIILSVANSYSIIVLEYDPEQKYQINETIINNTYSNHQTLCTIRSEYAEDRLTLLINILVAGVFNLALPSILILIVNIIMLCLIKRIYSTQAYENKNKRRSDVLTYRSTRSTLLVISVTYTLFYLPYVIFYFLIIILEDVDGTLYSLSEITYNLRHVSHSVNFYAYIFTNLRFRREILYFLRYIFRPCLNLRKRRQYKEKQKSRLILLDKSPLPPPLLFHPTRTRQFPHEKRNSINEKNEIQM